MPKNTKSPLKAVPKPEATPPLPAAKPATPQELCTKALYESQNDLKKSGNRYFGVITILFNGSEVSFRQSNGHAAMVGPTVAAMETTKALLYARLFAQAKPAQADAPVQTPVLPT